ncbi:MAG: GIY-YIG nuclease family protein [Opitutaceae bacterium]
MYFVYVIENPEGSLYVDHPGDLECRLDQHNNPEGKEHLGKYTLRNGPWSLIGSEEFGNRSEAMRLEKQLKSWKLPSKG